MNFENLLLVFLFIQVICYHRDLAVERTPMSLRVKQNKIKPLGSKVNKTIYTVVFFLKIPFVDLKPAERESLEKQILKLFSIAWLRNTYRDIGHLLFL